MKKILLTAMISVISVACAPEKDKPKSDIVFNDTQAQQLPPIPVNQDILAADGMGQAYQNDQVLQGQLQGIDVPSQEELISFAGDRVFFGTNSHTLGGESKDTLMRQAQWLQQNPNVNITVEGHCDERGTREFNLALGERRANSIKNFLVEQGIAPNRVTTISYGKEFPEFLGANEAAWSKNRRGVTVVN